MVDLHAVLFTPSRAESDHLSLVYTYFARWACDMHVTQIQKSAKQLHLATCHWLCQCSKSMLWGIKTLIGLDKQTNQPTYTC